ncbi:MAG: DUF3179 domain-containing protein [Alphaproteobacteria bacterium]|jgi:hypothetical protein|nr:DUF3179 domain-containing protein [Alphaproteobacteria bacterium]|tara:strand:- start:601 stop:1638 length:1038 start_codon:yes stop_codon:yes gene_type:complete
MRFAMPNARTFSVLAAAVLLVVALAIGFGRVSANPASWKFEWPRTDFAKTSVDFAEIMSGGPPKDGIPSIDKPKFVALDEAGHLKDAEPVIGLSLGGEMRAYPVQVLMWHEIVNDVIGGVPVAVTYCPLCNAAIVFDRRLDGRVLEFGTTGKLRRSDLVMYDRQTESWWQQFLGQAIVGELLGKTLEVLPARLESFARFRERAHAAAQTAQVLVPNRAGMRRYGANPYVGYDSLERPWLYSGAMPAKVAPLSRVVSLALPGGGRAAWSFPLLRRQKRIETSHGLIITWQPGQASALDQAVISNGFDVGNVVVQRRTKEGLVDVAYGVDFAFAFHAFFPNAPIHSE